MNWTIVAIKDRGIDAYVNMTVCRAEGQAIRQFIDIINDPSRKDLHQHPDDFDLYALGVFDDNTGTITSHEPRKIADGKQLSQGADNETRQ